jgi:hypothetical protein
MVEDFRPLKFMLVKQGERPPFNSFQWISVVFLEYSLIPSQNLLPLGPLAIDVKDRRQAVSLDRLIKC